MSDPRLNQIRIKTGILKRAAKEKLFYEKEAEDERKRLETMKSENKDQHDIRKQEEVINETLMMLPDSQKRIINAFNDLKAILQDTEFELSESQEFVSARTLIEEIQQLF